MWCCELSVSCLLAKCSATNPRVQLQNYFWRVWHPHCYYLPTSLVVFFNYQRTLKKLLCHTVAFALVSSIQ